MSIAVASAESAEPSLPKVAPPKIRKRSSKPTIKALVKAASQGDAGKIKALLGPFLTKQEQVVTCGLSARMGLIPTYNFYFMTDRRVGDLEITPLTGNLNVESAYLHKIDAFAINQPAITLLRVVLLLLYLWLALSGLVLGYQLGGAPVAILFGAAGVAAVKWVIAPPMRRIVLRFKKSGIFIKLTGSAVGTLIFADRKNFAALSSLSRRITEYKRQLDQQAA